MSNTRRNATPSWSGYLHQWQVGLLVAIVEISWLWSLEGINLGDHKLIFENAEDFDIQNSSGVLSRHQVNAFTTNWHQLTKYEHIYLNPDNFDCKDVDESHRFLHVIKKVPWFPVISHPANINKIQLYTYPDWNHFCGLNSVVTQAMMYTLGPTLVKENRFRRLGYELDKKVREAHKLGWWAVPELTFQEIYDILNDDTDFQEEYIAKLRETIIDALNEYKEISEESEDPNVWKRLQLVEEYIKYIYLLDNKQFREFIIETNFDQNHWKMLYLDRNGLHNVFMKTIYELGENKNEVERLLSKDKMKLTCIYRDERDIWGLVHYLQKTLSSWQLTKEFFEWYSFINKHINNKLLKITENNGAKEDRYNIQNLDITEYDITSPWGCWLISVDEAIKKLQS